MTQLANAIVNYLRQTSGRPPEPSLEGEEHGAARYYSDGTDEAGRWLGQGADGLGLQGRVNDDDFAAVLAGRHPRTGVRLISAQGSAGRRSRLGVGQATRRSPDGQRLFDVTDAAAVLGITKVETRRMFEVGALINDPGRRGPIVDALRRQPPGSYLLPVRMHGQLFVSDRELDRCSEWRAAGTTPDQAAATGDGSDDLPLAEAARIAGLTKEYLRRLARRYETADTKPDGEEVPGLGSRRAYLVARRGPKNEWIVKRRDLVEFLERREPPAVRVGFDATLTTEKSLGVLALLSGGAVRRAVLDAIRAGNDWAITWLEARCAVAREDGKVVPAKGWTVASFRHYTSRALDPFPHHHNVVCNTVEDDKGMRRALAARNLYREAKAASALATAEMRYRLTAALGIRWRRSRHGGWEIEGIPDAVLQEFSSRRLEIEEALHEIEDAIGRGTTPDEIDQVALSTRPRKTRAAVHELYASWWQRAEALGFCEADLAGCAGQLVEPPEPDIERIFARLAAPDGLCQNISIFNRGDLLDALANLPVSGDPDQEQPLIVPAARLEQIADDFLRSPWVEQLSDATEHAPARFSTREMLAVQDRIMARYGDGLHRRAAVVPPEAVEQILDAHPRLTDEQRDLVRSFTSSGHRIQSAIGHPGAGKTTSMLAARQAWEAAGFRVLGAAVKGEAARNLAASTGIPTETLAWHLAQDDPLASALDARTVLVVDEASTISDRDLDRLGWLAEHTGATLRLLGDPAQHGAVEAGGMFRVLCERHLEETPQLTQTHRLQDPHDRAAADALRAGQVDKALRHLAAAGHLHIVEDELDSYIKVLANWWRAHQANQHHPMVDRRNTVRRALNRLAHLLRDANGELGADHMFSHDRRFATGDRVIARTPNRKLHPRGERANYVRNGAQGTIAAVRRGHSSDQDVIVVTFDDIGTIELPRTFVDEHEIAPNQHSEGIDHAYAVTSYAVTGATQPRSTSRIDEASTRAETYVDVTRGESANDLYLTRAPDPLDGEHLPRTPPEPVAQAVADRLGESQGERTAWEIRQASLETADATEAIGI